MNINEHAERALNMMLSDSPEYRASSILTEATHRVREIYAEAGKTPEAYLHAIASTLAAEAAACAKTGMEKQAIQAIGDAICNMANIADHASEVLNILSTRINN